MTSQPPKFSPTLTIPNLLTMVRIFLTPLIIIFLIQGTYGRALIIFVLAGITDVVDGLIARAWQLKSPLGAYLDPVADKLLISSSFVTLSVFHKIPPWLAVLVISRDVVILGGVAVLKLFEVRVPIQPSRASKLATTLQVLVVFLVLLQEFWVFPEAVLTACFWLTAILTIASGLHYLARGLRYLSATNQTGS
ncbi:MAG: CDP-diacylglycerol--glycerol-3-phosphate 3-phosphatidyltransferase [Deltaproteobacteria bacterium]|nr:CDP-diacylglycerol--glycerol-3-phosphate 3-phosphatidyltransferase [Deltaproteobacteria bacterium]MBW2134804.1 CDP-diacylglycerol--glycerol-3-phosphate 3-phosphatidyltransferase [Deltaproteobacteria bacterium]